MKFRSWLETSAFLVVVLAFGLFAWIPEVPAPRAEDRLVSLSPRLSISEALLATPECFQPQIIKVEDPLEIPLVGMVLWGRLEDSAPYLEVARENCLAVVLTETPSGRWFWIPSWNSWDEKQEILDLFRNEGLEIPWSLSGPHSISVFPGHRNEGLEIPWSLSGPHSISVFPGHVYGSSP